MEVSDQARLAVLAANARLNARNGNVANGSAPGYLLRPNKPTPNRVAAAASAYSAGTPAKRASSALIVPPEFAKLPIEVDELLPHLSNARELYSARSAVAKNAMQLYGTMVDVMNDDFDIDDSAMEDGMSVMEDAELEHEAAVRGDGEVSEDSESSENGSMQVANSGFEARA